MSTRGTVVTTRSLFHEGADTFVEGEVLRLTFENAETGFRVAKLMVKGRKEPLTVVGTLPPVHAGARLRVRGKVVTDSRHGEQLRAESVTEMAPSTIDGIRRYLGSGVIPGVGEKLAAKIVSRFGEATLRVLDEEPERLGEIAGLGKKRRDKLVATWREKHAERDVLVFLQAHGASPALAARIMKRYGPTAAHVVRKDPYRLALDVVGVGFKTADRIAQGLGIAADAPERIQAGLLQSLLDMTESGHVFSPAGPLADRAMVLLGLGDAAAAEALLSRGLRALAFGGHVLIEGEGVTAHVYLPRMLEAEKRLAARIQELGAARVRPLMGATLAIEAFERDANVTLADEQRAAVEEASRAPLFVVTGGPGVGKTTVLKAMLSVLQRAGLVVKLAAPTGRAAKRMTAATSVEATTIHRLLEYDPQKGGTWKRNADRRVTAGAVIIDEASMIDLPLADALLQAVAPGTRLILVGDKDQLPSIGPGAVLRDVILSKAMPAVHLKTIFRQAAASHIVVNAHRVHEGLAPLGSPPDDPHSDFFIIDRRDPETATSTIIELVSSRIPKRFGLDPVRDIQVLTPMHKGAAGSVAINLALQAALNPTGEPLSRGSRLFRCGDKVMQLKNDYDRSVWNGDVGVISDVDRERGSLRVRFDDEGGAQPRLVAYEPRALDDLTLAYACSVHKAQGSEYPAVIIPLLTSHFVMLTKNLFYTAITRGKRLVVLVADPRAIQLALAEGRREERHTHLAERIMAASSSLRRPH